VKNYMVIFSIVLLGTNVYAQKSMFVGLDVGNTNISVSVSRNSLNNTIDVENPFSLKIGTEYDDYRTYGKYLDASIDHVDINAFTVHYEKYFPIKFIKPYVGIGAGIVRGYEVEHLPGIRWNPIGLAYGASTGVWS